MPIHILYLAVPFTCSYSASAHHSHSPPHSITFPLPNRPSAPHDRPHSPLPPLSYHSSSSSSSLPSLTTPLPPRSYLSLPSRPFPSTPIPFSSHFQEMQSHSPACLPFPQLPLCLPLLPSLFCRPALSLASPSSFPLHCYCLLFACFSPFHVLSFLCHFLFTLIVFSFIILKILFSALLFSALL